MVCIQPRRRKLGRIWRGRSTGNGALRSLRHICIRCVMLIRRHHLLRLVLLLWHHLRWAGLSWWSIHMHVVRLAERHIGHTLPLMELLLLDVRRQHSRKARLLTWVTAKVRSRSKDLRRR